MEIFYEKNIVNDRMDKNNVRNKIFKICRIICFIIFFLLLFYVLAFRRIVVDKGTAQLVLSIIFMFVILAFPIGGIFVFTRLISLLNCEYDYFIIGNQFRIVKVLNRVKRKKFFELSLDSISAIGIVDSDDYVKLSSNHTIKIISAYCNASDDLAYLYITCDINKKMILIQIDKQFLFALKKACNPTIFSDSANSYLLQKSEIGDNDER